MNKSPCLTNRSIYVPNPHIIIYSTFFAIFIICIIYFSQILKLNWFQIYARTIDIIIIYTAYTCKMFYLLWNFVFKFADWKKLIFIYYVPCAFWTFSTAVEDFILLTLPRDCSGESRKAGVALRKVWDHLGNSDP